MRTTRSMSDAAEKTRLAELLWPQLSGDVITRLVEVAPASVLPTLALLESRACMPARARLSSLLQLWEAQEQGHINCMCQPFELLELMGNGNPGEWWNRRLSVFDASEPQGLAALADGLSAGAFPRTKQLDINYTNVSDAGLSLLIRPLRQGALPLLEEISIARGVRWGLKNLRIPPFITPPARVWNGGIVWNRLALIGASNSSLDRRALK